MGDVFSKILTVQNTLLVILIVLIGISINNVMSVYNDMSSLKTKIDTFCSVQNKTNEVVEEKLAEINNNIKNIQEKLKPWW